MFSLLSGQAYRKVAASPQKGPEYHGPCPVCGGKDRFHIWPEQAGGTFWCRSCEKQGDLIEFYRWRDNLSYRDACAKAGVSPQVYSPQSAPAIQRRAASASFAPAASSPVEQVWADHAAKFALWCYEQLLANVDQQSWLAKRGITAAMVAKYTLGWNPKDAYRQRAAWGLPEQRRTDGQPKKLWLPLGLVIPQWIEGKVARLRIRRPNPEPGQAKYYVVPGSGREPLISEPSRSAYVVVESELDAILVDGVAGDLVGAVSMGNASAKPTDACHAQLVQAVHLSICLDSDAPHRNPTTGKMESAGAQGSLWWIKQYRQAVRVPIIGGKDPGEAFERGLDLRTWVLAGLPPRFHLATKFAPQHPSPLADQSEQGFERVSPVSPAQAEEKPTHQVLTLANGQEIHLVDNQELWEQLVGEGLIVFSHNELQRLQAALAGLQGNERIQAVQAAVDAKSVFPGAYIRRGEIIPETETTEEV